MEVDHFPGDVFAGIVVIKAAVDVIPVVDELCKPKWVMVCAGGGDGKAAGIETEVAYGIDSGFTEDNSFCRWISDGEVAEVFSGACGHTFEGDGGSSVKLSTDNPFFFSK